MLVLVENVVFLRSFIYSYYVLLGKGAGTPLWSVCSKITTHLQHFHSLSLPLCIIKRLLVVLHNTSSHKHNTQYYETRVSLCVHCLNDLANVGWGLGAACTRDGHRMLCVSWHCSSYNKENCANCWNLARSLGQNNYSPRVVIKLTALILNLIPSSSP